MSRRKRAIKRLKDRRPMTLKRRVRNSLREMWRSMNLTLNMEKVSSQEFERLFPRK